MIGFLQALVDTICDEDSGDFKLHLVSVVAQLQQQSASNEEGPRFLPPQTPVSTRSNETFVKVAAQ